MSEFTPQGDLGQAEPEESGVLGADFGGEEPLDMGQVGQGSNAGSQVQNQNSEDFDPYSADWHALQPDQVPEQYRPLIQDARKIHSMVNKTNMELREQQRQLKDTQDQYIRMIEAMNRGGNQESTPEQQQVAALAQLGFHPESDGFQDAATVMRIAQAANNPVQQQLAQITQALQGLTQHVSSQQMQQQQTAEKQTESEIIDAESAYSQDIYNYTAQIKSLRGQQNPSTGKPYTVKEAYEFTKRAVAPNFAPIGQAVQQPQNGGLPPFLQAAQRQAGPSFGGAAHSRGQVFTPDEELKQMRSLGFQ